jgi:uncharacterized Fe-S center protein
MKKAKVVFAAVSTGESIESVARKAARAAEAAGIRGIVHKGRPCAVKQHFGEGRNTGYVKPAITAAPLSAW